MEEGIPPSFLDLILSALAGLIILTSISPNEEEKNYVQIDIKFTSDSTDLIYDPFYEIKIGEDIYSSDGINTLEDALINIKEDGVTIDIATTDNADNIQILLSIAEDRGLINDEEFAVMVLVNGVSDIFSLNRSNHFMAIRE